MMGEWDIETLPIQIRKHVASSHWQPILIGKSGSCVYLLTDEKNSRRYLKITAKTLRLDLKREGAILQWLDGKLPVPKVLAFASSRTHEYLLISEIKGRVSSDPSFHTNLREFIRILAHGLRAIHSLDIHNCPFSNRLDRKLNEAKERMDRGLVDEENFDPIRQGRTAAELYEELLKRKPETEDLVFTHGDFCLPNILIAKGKISGYIDWGRGGVADRYQDLALIARGLKRKFGADWVALFFQEYGLNQMDDDKIAYYQLLDEFF